VRLPLSVPREAAYDVVTFGENSIDYIAGVSVHPPANSKQPMQYFSRLPGGQTATAAVAAARLGCRTRYIGAFGGDDNGTLARDWLLREGVDLSAAVVMVDARNRVAVIIADAASGARTVLWDRDPRLTIERDALPHHALQSGRILLVDTTDIGAAIEAARQARRAGVVTMVDVDTVQPEVRALLAEIDIIVSAESFPEALTGERSLGAALHALARATRAPLVIATLGERGSCAVCGGREVMTPAFPIACVDSTGAGDAFRAGLAAAILAAPHDDLEEMLRYANAVAALNCRAQGASTALPVRDEVAALLAGAART
jgi:sugar/nucleoside kinase (ribokinase family)